MRIFAAFLVAVTLTLTLAAESHAGPTAKAPDPAPIIWPQGPCNLQHRMDVAIVEGMFFECQCLRLQTGYVCDWYLVAGVQATDAKKRRIKAHARRVYRFYALPQVTA